MTIALDALDEASEPAGIADRLIRPLAQRGWRFLVGSRPSAAARGANGLLDRLGPGHRRDLDGEETTEGDIARYVERRLTQTPASPYAEHTEDVAAIAAGVARKAAGRFLFARLAVAGLLRRARIGPDELDAATGGTVGDVVARDLSSTDDAFAVDFGRSDPGASALLAALAWAEGHGVPLRDGIWRTMASALHPAAPPFGDAHVQWALRQAGRYIIESGDGEQAIYRLFHESLNEHFRAGRDPAEAGTRIAEALLRDVDEHGGWDDANPHVVRYLPAYYEGAPAGLERLFTDPRYLRRALDLLGVDRLADVLVRAYRTHKSSAIEAVAKSVQRARVALSRDPTQLAAQLHARLADERAGALRRLLEDLPRAAPRFWLRSRGATLGWRASLRTMQTFYAKVRALAFGFVDGEGVIAVGAGTEVTLWNPRQGALPSHIGNDGLRVSGLAIGVLDGRAVLAVASGHDGQLVIRDARNGVAIGEPLPCGSGTVAMGRFEGQDAVVIPAADGYMVHAIDAGWPALAGPIAAEAVGHIGDDLVALEREGSDWRVVRLATGNLMGREIALSPEVKLVAVGEIGGEPVLCHATAQGVDPGARPSHRSTGGRGGGDRVRGAHPCRRRSRWRMHRRGG